MVTLRLLSRCTFLVSILGAVSLADVRPPITAKLDLNIAAPAVSGEEYVGTIEIMTGLAGVLDGLTLEGEGWHFTSVGNSGPLTVDVGEVVSIDFAAIPKDGDKPFSLAFTIDDVEFRKSFDVSPLAFERAFRRGVSTTNGGLPIPPRDQLDPDPPTGSAAAGGQTIHFTGRIIYRRQDGMVLGADGVLIRLMDRDAISDETMYEGVTDFDGRFDVTINWEDCDISGCDVPDIYLYIETDTPVAVVQDDSIFEEVYSWQFEVMNDFAGNSIPFGHVEPPGNHPALHILSTLTKAHPFILQNDGTDVEQVDVQWPESDDGAFYIGFFDEIHIGPSQQWNEGTIIHEYGHHYLENYALNLTPDYCNGVCDEEGRCSHCMWCPETNHDAWNEGWPNWLGGAIMRSYFATYRFNPQFLTDGRYNPESVAACQQDGNLGDPFITEGFLAALLQDIEDAGQDNQTVGPPFVPSPGPPDCDGRQIDCDIDAMNLGTDEIFQMARVELVTNPAEFLNKWRTRYPQFDMDFWSTVRNVSCQYSFPIPAVTITSPPQSCASARTGQPLAITVAGNGSLLSFQWRRNGTNLADDGRIVGSAATRAGSSTLTINPLQAGDEALYDVVVTSCDLVQQITSSPIRVRVHPALGGGTAAVSWGRNLNGALGHGEFEPEIDVPNPVVDVSNFMQIANGLQHSVGLRGDGTVWSWGSNFLGELGDGTTVPSPVPVQSAIADVVAVSAGNFYSVAVRADGTLFTWGDNNFGTLGIPGPSLHVPTAVPGMNCVTDVAAGSLHAVAINSDGSAWTWGYNSNGQLGHGPSAAIVGVPTPMIGVTDAVEAAAGDLHTVIRTQNGSLLACGFNGHGQLGIGNDVPADVAQPVVGVSNILSISSHGFHTLAVRNDGTAWAWGDGSSGQIGTGNLDGSNIPLQVSGLSNVAHVGAAYYSSAFMLSNGTIWVCGINSHGGLGVPVAGIADTPVPLTSIVGATDLFAGSEHLTILAPPQPASIVQQPGPRTFLDGQTATLQVTATGTPQLLYQWSKNGFPLPDGNGISGVETADLSISPVVISDAGSYTVMISNAYGDVASTAAVLTVSTIAGDIDGDNLVGLLDFAAMFDCQIAPGVGPNPVSPGLAPESCLAIFDNELDGDVDLHDFGVFQNAFAP